MSENVLNYDDLRENLELPIVKKGPIDRRQLVDYASASGDYNKIHYDDEFAKKAGLGGTIVHGMLVMALMGSYITDWAKGGKLKNFFIRFIGITRENDTLTMKGKIVKKYEENGEKLIEIEVLSENQETQITTSGTALIKF
ncbi:MAG: MaoC/PaaZ C-terminal domain-containing protein [Candidatus Thorarchaeota archaeon]